MNNQLLFKDKIDACIFFDPANRYYFTRTQTSNGCVVVLPNKTYFITDSRYELNAKERLESQKLTDIELVIAGREGMLKELTDILSGYKIKAIGYEDSLTHASFLLYKEAFKGVSFKSVSAAISTIRSIKTPEEIELIAASQAVNEQALTKALKYIKAGQSERSISAEIIYALIQAGAEKPSFDSIVAIGENSAKPHSMPSDRELSKGEHIMIDMGAKVNGYCSDMTRCFAIGQPPKELVKMYNDVLLAQEYALKNIKAGITASEADSFAREFLQTRGYTSEFSHSLGHGVGVDIHELPWVSPRSDTVLEENMVITVEPGVYIPSLGGIRIEDLVVVTKNGIRNLTNFAKDFII